MADEAPPVVVELVDLDLLLSSFLDGTTFSLIGRLADDLVVAALVLCSLAVEAAPEPTVRAEADFNVLETGTDEAARDADPGFLVATGIDSHPLQVKVKFLKVVYMIVLKGISWICCYYLCLFDVGSDNRNRLYHAQTIQKNV